MKKNYALLIFALCACFIGTTKLQAQFVYPGDVNNDGIANNLDYIYLGLELGEVGIPREPVDMGIDWQAYPFTLWGVESFGQDLGYFDCDGNGVIDEIDLMAVQVNQGMTHDLLIEPSFMQGEEGVDPQLYFNNIFVQDIFPEGGIGTMDIFLGTEEIPVPEFHGIAFTISFDPQLMTIGLFEFDLAADFGGTPLHMLSSLDDNGNPIEPGRLEIALTVGNDEALTNTFGQLGNFLFIIEDNLVGFVNPEIETYIQLENITILDSEMNVIPTVNDSIQILIENDNLLADTSQDLEQFVKVYPNPASNHLTIESNDLKINQIHMFNSLGQRISITDPEYQNDVVRLSFKDLSDGFYFLYLHTDAGLLTKKVFISKERP